MKKNQADVSRQLNWLDLDKHLHTPFFCTLEQTKISYLLTIKHFPSIIRTMLYVKGNTYIFFLVFIVLLAGLLFLFIRQKNRQQYCFPSTFFFTTRLVVGIQLFTHSKARILCTVTVYTSNPFPISAFCLVKCFCMGPIYLKKKKWRRKTLVCIHAESRNHFNFSLSNNLYTAVTQNK